MSWRYKIDQPFIIHAPELGCVSFENDWLSLDGCGLLRVSAGYAWDGCSPAVKIFGVWLGTPDGKLGIDGRPQTFYASLVHDVLCQFAKELPIFDAKPPSDLFYRMLLDAGFSKLRAAVYRAAVLNFGPQDWGDVYLSRHA